MHKIEHRLMFYSKKSLGQNFLINAGVLKKIVAAAEINPDDTVLEIGPGTGNLTKLLSEKAGQVIAVEKDRRLIDDLRERFKNSNVEVFEGDVLGLKIETLIGNRKLKAGKFKIVGNIPYYITSNLLRTIFESASWRMARPSLIVLMIQKEVAQRILAEPPHMNLLALSVQFYAEPKIIGYVSRGSFRPIPDVNSAIIKLIPRLRQGHIPEALLLEERGVFFKLVRAGFREKRKKLINNLAKNFSMMKEDLSEIFERVGIKHDTRAENLSLSQWIELSKLIKK